MLKDKVMLAYRTRYRFQVLMVVFLGIWVIAHLPGLLYGTEKYPLHASSTGSDEQVSVNGALHMLKEKSILGFRNRPLQYYGPLLVITDTPGVIADFAVKYATGLVHSAEEYKHYIVWDWGGILINIRLTAIFSMLLGLLLVYKLASTHTFNQTKIWYMPYLAAALVACNYYYFEWSHFSLHWAYVVPLLFAQYYTLVRIQETEGGTKKYWILHGAAIAASFGISYFSIIFTSMWLPTLVRMVRRRDWDFARRCIIFVAGLISVLALIVMWHPYAFLRYFSFVGIGQPMSAIGDAQNPFVLSDPSWGFYAKVIVLNHLSLMLAFSLLLVLVWRTGVLRSAMLWMIVLPGIMNFLLFAPAVHHEGRYALPTIISFILAFVYILGRYVADTSLHQRLATVALWTFVSWYFIFHIVHIGVWMDIYAHGPIDAKAAATARELQKTGSPVLIVGSYLLGVAHTTDSYKAFQRKRALFDSELYRTMLTHPPTDDRVLLDARYATRDDITRRPQLLSAYPHTILFFNPQPNAWILQTFFDEDMVRNWYYWALTPSYILLDTHKTETSTSTKKTSVISREFGDKSKTLTALLKKNISQTCTFAISENFTEIHGTVYINKKIMRLDADVTSAIKVLTKRMILYDGSYYYLWNKGNPQGIKLSNADMMAYGNTPEGPTTVVGLDQVVEYECKPDKATPTLFLVPDDVIFTDFRESM